MNTHTRSSKPWVFICTSSIWWGDSSFLFSFFWKNNHGTRTGTTASDRCLPQDLGIAVHPQHRILSRRLLPLSGLPQVDSDRRVHVVEGGADRRRLHAHGLG